MKTKETRRHVRSTKKVALKYICIRRKFDDKSKTIKTNIARNAISFVIGCYWKVLFSTISCENTTIHTLHQRNTVTAEQIKLQLRSQV